MRTGIRLGVLGVAAVIGALVLSAGPAMAAGSNSSRTAYTCTGGDVPSGTYASITIAGACQVPSDGSAVISVVGNLNVAAGAFFDAQSAPSTITVGRNVTAAAGSLLGLGCQPDGAHAGHQCTFESDRHSTITVNGNVTATDADTVLLNGITVKKNVTLTGGGGDFPWAEKNNTIGGNFTASGVTPEWFGLLFNRIAGNATLTNITSTDPEDQTPVVSIVVNTVGRNLNCTGLGPAVSGGFIPGEVNFVGRHANGQCAALV